MRKLFLLPLLALNFSASPAFAQSLTTGLVACWSMDESSGSTRVDAVGGHDLTSNDTTAAAAATFNNGLHIVSASPGYLSRAGSDTALSPGDADFTIAVRLRFDDDPVTRAQYQAVAGRWAAVGYEYLLYYEPVADLLTFAVTSDGSTGTVASVVASTFGTLSATTWYLAIAKHDSVNNQISISINGTANTASHSAGVYTSNATPFQVGEDGGFAFAADAIYDELAFWTKVTSGAEDALLYNGGTGLACSGFAGAGGGGSTSRGLTTLGVGQ